MNQMPLIDAEVIEASEVPAKPLDVFQVVGYYNPEQRWVGKGLYSSKLFADAAVERLLAKPNYTRVVIFRLVYDPNAESGEATQ